MNRGTRAGGAVHFPNDVKQARVHASGLIDAPVPKEMIELLQGIGDVRAVTLERDRGAFLRVRVEDGQRAAII